MKLTPKKTVQKNAVIYRPVSDPKFKVSAKWLLSFTILFGWKKNNKKKLEMCQYDTDAPTQGHNHPQAGILQKMKLKKGHNSQIGRFYPKSNLTYILWLYTCV